MNVVLVSGSGNVTLENANEILENESGTWNVNFSCSYYVLEGNYGGLYPARRLICWYTTESQLGHLYLTV